MKKRNKFMEQAESIIQECEEQIKDLEKIIKIKKNESVDETDDTN
jgi:hypothetical protein